MPISRRARQILRHMPARRERKAEHRHGHRPRQSTIRKRTRRAGLSLSRFFAGRGWLTWKEGRYR